MQPAPTPVMPANADDLRALGLTEAQIERLRQLRAQYPHLEWTETTKEWQRLTFLKWEVETGRR